MSCRLCHNVIGPHNEAFHKLWNELRDEYTDLKIKGYTGEGFLSEGHRLGGAGIPQSELRRQRRLAAEKRNTLQKGSSGQRLGGRPIPRSTDIRSVISDAVSTRRQTITQGCGSGNRDRDERIANEATRNGFRTQAEEDQANQLAINEALWELAQQDETNQELPDPMQWKSEGLHWDSMNGLEVPAPLQKHKRSHSDMAHHTATWFEDDESSREPPRSAGMTPEMVPPAVPRQGHLPDTPRPESDTLGNDGFSTSKAPRPRPQSSQPANSSKIRPKVFLPEKAYQSRPPPIEEHPAFRHSNSSYNSSNHSAAPSVSSFTSSNPTSNGSHPSAFFSPVEQNQRRHSAAAPTPVDSTAGNSPQPPPIIVDSTWTCPSCTLVNPSDFLCCDACTGPRPCLGTIADFSSLQDMGPDALPTQSPSSPAELPGSAVFWDDRNSPTSEYSSRPASTRSLARMTAAQRTARSLAAASKNAASPQDKRIGWLCHCGTFNEEKWWICTSCNQMKTTS